MVRKTGDRHVDTPAPRQRPSTSLMHYFFGKKPIYTPSTQSEANANPKISLPSQPDVSNASPIRKGNRVPLAAVNKNTPISVDKTQDKTNQELHSRHDITTSSSTNVVKTPCSTEDTSILSDSTPYTEAAFAFEALPKTPLQEQTVSALNLNIEELDAGMVPDEGNKNTPQELQTLVTQMHESSVPTRKSPFKVTKASTQQKYRHTIRRSPCKATNKDRNEKIKKKRDELKRLYPKFAKWAESTLEENAELKRQIQKMERQNARLNSTILQQNGANKLLSLGLQHKTAQISATSHNDVREENHSVNRSKSELIDSLLQLEDQKTGKLAVELTSSEQAQLWKEYKALSDELEGMSELLERVRQSMVALTEDRSQLRKELDGRNQLITRLFSAEATSDVAVTTTLGTMRKKMELQVELRRAQPNARGADESIASIDQSFIVDRLQSMIVGSDPDSSKMMVNHSNVDQKRPTCSRRVSPCLVCRQPVGAENAKKVHPIGLVHKSCFRCSAFGCRTMLKPGDFSIHDSRLFCSQHAQSTNEKQNQKLCAV